MDSLPKLTYSVIPVTQLYNASLLYVYCAAVCTSSCQNGGTCTAPNTCTCDVGYTGMQCETGTHKFCLVQDTHMDYRVYNYTYGFNRSHCCVNECFQ